LAPIQAFRDSNNIQNLHEKIQTSLSHTVDSESRFSSNDADCNFLDRRLENLTAQGTEFNTHLQKLSNDTMGNALKKHKADLKHTTNNNTEITVQNHIETEQNDETKEELPALILSDTTGSDQCIVNYEKSNTNCKEIDSTKSTSNSEEKSLSTMNVENELTPQELNRHSKRDSAYESSLESSQMSANSDVISPAESHDITERNTREHSKILSDFPSALLANKWSSTSSLASDSIDGPPSPHDCEHSTCSALLTSKEPMHLRNLSSSSNFSLR